MSQIHQHDLQSTPPKTCKAKTSQFEFLNQKFSHKDDEADVPDEGK